MEWHGNITNIFSYVLKSHEYPFLIYRCNCGQLNYELALVKEQKCISSISQLKKLIGEKWRKDGCFMKIIEFIHKIIGKMFFSKLPWSGYCSIESYCLCNYGIYFIWNYYEIIKTKDLDKWGIFKHVIAIGQGWRQGTTL